MNFLPSYCPSGTIRLSKTVPEGPKLGRNFFADEPECRKHDTPYLFRVIDWNSYVAWSALGHFRNSQSLPFVNLKVVKAALFEELPELLFCRIEDFRCIARSQYLLKISNILLGFRRAKG